MEFKTNGDKCKLSSILSDQDEEQANLAQSSTLMVRITVESIDQELLKRYELSGERNEEDLVIYKSKITFVELPEISKNKTQIIKPKSVRHIEQAIKNKLDQ